MKTSEFLRQSKAVIDTPEKWTKKAVARGQRMGHQVAVQATAPDATCWCSVGAMMKMRWALQPTMPITDGSNLQGRANAFLETVARKLGFREVEQFNDNPHTTHDEVMGLFDDAIVLAEREGD